MVSLHYTFHSMTVIRLLETKYCLLVLLGSYTLSCLSCHVSVGHWLLYKYTKSHGNYSESFKYILWFILMICWSVYVRIVYQVLESFRILEFSWLYHHTKNSIMSKIFFPTLFFVETSVKVTYGTLSLQNCHTNSIILRQIG